MTDIFSQSQFANIQSMSNVMLAGFTLLLAWSLVWKGIALWKSARLSHKKWFVVMLIINTFGIIEIIYIFFVARKYVVETEEHEGVEVK